MPGRVLHHVVCSLLLLVPACAGRGCFGRVPIPTIRIRWPASAPVDLRQEIFATAIEDGIDQIVPGEPLPDDVAGVRVREEVVEGIYLLEVILGDAEFDDPLPMVVLLHGRGDRPRVPGGPFGGVPTPMRLILPRAPKPLGEGFAWLPVTVRDNKLELLSAALQLRTEHLADLIESLVSTRPTLGLPIVTGFSQGGMLSFALAVQHPERFAEALPNSAWLPPRLVPLRPPPTKRPVRIRALHGAADEIVPIGPTREVVAQMSARAWDVELAEFADVGHVMTEEMNAAFEVALEAALRRQAPALSGGLGEAGPEGQPYPPFEPLDAETLAAIEKASAAAPESAND